MERRRFIKGLTVLAAAPVILPLIPEAAPMIRASSGYIEPIPYTIVHPVVEEAYLLTEGMRFRNFNFWFPPSESVYASAFCVRRSIGVTHALQHFIEHGKYPPPYELLNNLIPRYAEKEKKIWSASTVEEMETLPQAERDNWTS